MGGPKDGAARRQLLDDHSGARAGRGTGTVPDDHRFPRNRIQRESKWARGGPSNGRGSLCLARPGRKRGPGPAAVTPFQVREDDGRLVAEPGAPPEVEDLVAGLAPDADVWRDLEVEGGPDGILARRPIKMKGNPQGYVYDLWLVERLADRLGG